MKQIRRTKKQVLKALEQVVKTFISYKDTFKLSDGETKKRVLHTYEDFYEWLTDKSYD